MSKKPRKSDNKPERVSHGVATIQVHWPLLEGLELHEVVGTYKGHKMLLAPIKYEVHVQPTHSMPQRKQ